MCWNLNYKTIHSHSCQIKVYIRLQQYTGCEWNVKTQTYLHSSLNYGNLPFLIRLFLSDHFTMKNKFRKITSVWVCICYMTWYPSLYRWPFCFQGPARHRAATAGATATQYTGDVFDATESVNWTCFEHDFSLSSSFCYFWWFIYLQFGEIGLSRDQRHDKFVQCRRPEGVQIKDIVNIECKYDS